MTNRNRKDDLQTMLRDPAAVFSTPRDVLDRLGLTRDERLAILRQWERDARGLSVAEEEGMGGGEESLLSRVRLAIARLGEAESRAARARSTASATALPRSQRIGALPHD